MTKLTKRFVEGLTAEGKDFIAFDSEVNGFGVRVMPSGRKSYIIQYRSGGRTCPGRGRQGFWAYGWGNHIGSRTRHPATASSRLAAQSNH